MPAIRAAHPDAARDSLGGSDGSLSGWMSLAPAAGDMELPPELTATRKRLLADAQ